MNNHYDFLIVGAGFSGAVLAERLAAELNRKVLVVEKRSHIAGNAYDCYDSAGVLVHLYGPHIFHTSFEDVWSYLSRFTQWNGYVHKVLSFVNGQTLPIPINRTTVSRFFNKPFTEQEVKDYLQSVSLKLDSINNSEDVIVSQVGELFYNLFFKHYTYKQWGVYPSQLAPEVTRRIPVRYNDDDRYFTDPYQGLPLEGYTKLFENMLSHPNITVALNTDYKAVMDAVKFDRMIYTGPVDYFFDYLHGKLPYRSIEFQWETYEQEYFQECGVVNYPNDFAFTRITEFKRMTLQQHPKTTIIKEFPTDKGDPFYPIPMQEALQIAGLYQQEREKLQSVYFVGRLAEYRYFNMDQVVKRALDLFHEIAQGKG
jgi:UDP-galactopyranose mutase